MVKPISGFPELRGKEAIRFMREFLEEQEHPSPERVRFIKEAIEFAKHYTVEY